MPSFAVKRSIVRIIFTMLLDEVQPLTIKNVDVFAYSFTTKSCLLWIGGRCGVVLVKSNTVSSFKHLFKTFILHEQQDFVCRLPECLRPIPKRIFIVFVL